MERCRVAVELVILELAKPLGWLRSKPAMEVIHDLSWRAANEGELLFVVLDEVRRLGCPYDECWLSRKYCSMQGLRICWLKWAIDAILVTRKVMKAAKPVMRSMF